MNKHKSNKIKENSNTVRHLIMGQITTTQNLVAIKLVRHAGQKRKAVSSTGAKLPDFKHNWSENCTCKYTMYISTYNFFKFWYIEANTKWPQQHLVLVQIMAWCRAGDKSLSEPMMIILPTIICITLHVKLNIQYLWYYDTAFIESMLCNKSSICQFCLILWSSIQLYIILWSSVQLYIIRAYSKKFIKKKDSTHQHWLR